MASVPTASDSGGSQMSVGQVPSLGNGAEPMDISSYSAPPEVGDDLPSIAVEDFAKDELPKVPQFAWSEMSYKEDQDCLGQGSFGVCYKVKHQILGTAVLKILQQKPTTLVGGDTDDGVFKQRREMSLGLLLNHHPNIVAFFGYAYREDRDHPEAFLMEYMAGGNLFSYICDNFKKPLAVARANSWSRQIAQGLCFMHSRRIMHRDLNPNNILLSRDLMTAKIADFGLSKKVEAEDLKHTRKVGTELYRAPEVFINGKYTHQVDIWSYAMTLYFLYYQQHPFDEDKLKKLGSFARVQKLTGGFRPEIGRFPDVQDRVMVGCWNTVPKNRWRIRKVLDELDKFPVDIFPVENV